MIIEVSSDPGDTKRIFFGLNSDGSYLFQDDNTHQFTMTASISNNKRHYPENFCVPIIENEFPKEYIISISNEDQFIELYDFENNHIYEVKSEEKFRKKILSIRNSSANILYNGINYIIFLSCNNITENPVSHSFMAKALKFTSKDIEQNIGINIVKQHYYNLTQERSSMTSCFVSESNLIWNMGLIQEEEVASYYIIIYSPDNMGIDLFVYNFKVEPFLDRIFFKIVHLKGDIGVALFFAYQNGTNSFFPFL